MGLDWRCAWVVIVLASTMTAAAADSRDAKDRAVAQATLMGYVRDAACLFDNPDAGAPVGEIPHQCALACLTAGGPPIVYTKEGGIYFILSGKIPDESVNARLIPFVGKPVKITGRLLERDGHKVITLDAIEFVQDTRAAPAAARVP